jgi:hypothetical protein
LAVLEVAGLFGVFVVLGGVVGCVLVLALDLFEAFVFCIYVVGDIFLGVELVADMGHILSI